MPSLFVIQGRDQGKRFELTKPVLRVGRDKSNSIQLHDTEVSRRHAEVQCREDSVYLVDLDSSNGSWVDGVQVNQPVPLSDGSQIRIGSWLNACAGV